MIKLGRFSGAMFAAALLLCAFPVATSSQDKTAPSTSPSNPHSNVFLEDEFEKLQIEFRKSKQDLERKIDTIDQKLNSLIAQLPVRGNESPALPSPSPVWFDGRSSYSDSQSCCRHINYHIPCCGYVYHHEPCCREAYHRVRHVYHPRQIYHAQPCCRYAYRELD
jgi:hypothetical protein